MKKKLILGLLCGCMVFGSSSVWASSTESTSNVAEQQEVVDESATDEEGSATNEEGSATNEEGSGEEQGIYSFDVSEALSEDAEEISDILDNEVAAYNSDAGISNEVESAKQNGWVDEADGRHYYEDGVEVVNRYVHDNDKWYWMDKNGVMSTGVTLIGNRYYYFDKNGVESYATGWIQDENGWYFASEDRTLLCNQWLWRPSGWYWLGSDCRMATGMTNIEGTTYYMNADGTMTVGWVLVGSDYYYFNPDGGGMLHGWLRRPSGWYYLNDETGKMDIGWKQVKGNWYYLHPGTGEALHDWQFINGSWYYLSDTIEDCSMKTGWIQSKGIWYYCMPEGAWKSLNVAVVGKNDGNSQVCAAAMQKLGMNPTVVTRNYDPSSYDAMIIPGGGDIDPSRYGEVNKSSRDVDNALDDYQLKAINATWEANKPILGICKGIQLLNVYFGGTLNQNIFNHMGVWHDVYTTSRSNWCADLSYDGRVLSYHHQSIKKVASVFTVDLKAPDGTVEAVHSTVGKVYGVQFHPEQMNNELGTNYLKRIMEKFIF